MILLPILFFLLLAYSVLILWIWNGWNKLSVAKSESDLPETIVSVIIAARNEENTIGRLLDALDRQEYPDELLEIIIVDDHSEDLTKQKILDRLSLAGKRKIHVLSNKEGVSGKKSAIHEGITHAKGQLIVTTDADCNMGPQWISSLVSLYESRHPKMILAPVELISEGSLLELFQVMEFTSLMAVTAGSAGQHLPLLANGANLAYEKSAYLECGGFANNAAIPSGDDIFMLSSIRRRYGGKSIVYLKDPGTIVKTPAEKSLSSFFNQRMRWVSKSSGYKDWAIIVSSLLVFGVQVSMFLLLVAACFSRAFLVPAGLYFLIKLLVDLPLMYAVSGFYRQRKLLWLFPVLELLNCFYTVIVGLLGNMLPNSWKGRKVIPGKSNA